MQDEQNEAKEQKGRFLGMLLGTLGAFLLGNMWAQLVVESRDGVIRAGRGIIRVGKAKDF